MIINKKKWYNENKYILNMFLNNLKYYFKKNKIEFINNTKFKHELFNLIYNKQITSIYYI